MNTAAALLLGSSLGLSLLQPHDGRRLSIEHGALCYDWSIHNDTITVTTQKGELLSYEVIVGDSIVQKQSLTIEGLSRWDSPLVVSTHSSLACLYKREENLYLSEWRAGDRKRTIDTKIPAALISPYCLLPWDSTYLIIFRNYDKRFTLNSHSLDSEYGPLAYRTVRNGVVSETKPIESGRISSYSLQTIVARDTLYAVWNRTEHKSFLTWVWNTKSSLVCAKYDGSAWSAPQPFYDYDYEQRVMLLGLYELHGQLYCFLKEEAPDGTSDRILYMKADDRQHWSAPLEVMRCTGFLNEWLARSDGNGKLHMIIADTRKKCPSYATFDGTTLEQKYDIELVNSQPRSLAADKGKVYLFYFTSADAGAPDTSTATASLITKKVVTEQGDTASVMLLRPYDKEAPEKETKDEFFVMPL